MPFRTFHSCPILLLLATFACQSVQQEKPPVQELKSDTIVTVKHAPWVAQSNIYEVNVRQYTREGTFKAFEKHLPRLRAMGVETLWFMPVTPISKIDRKGTLGSYYAVSDYKTVNPEFGTMEDFKSLVRKAHDLGFKVITDWVPNHSGADHKWLQTNPNFYYLDSSGKAKYAFDWSDTRELNYDNMALRDSMISAMQFWIRETGIDGFRVDVAGEVPVNFWKECIPKLRAMKEIFLLAEADKAEVHLAGFDASYPWDFFQTIKKIAAGQTNALALDSFMMRQDSTFPSNAYRLFFTSNHDENSWNKSDFGTFPGLKHAAFAVLTQTLPRSVPLIYSGQEEPVLRAISFFEKDNMNFRNYRREKFYKVLLQLRRQNPALAADASFTRVKVGSDSALYAYVREKGENKIAVILNLSAKKQEIKILDERLKGEPMNLFLGVKEPFTLNHHFGIEPWGYVVCVYK
ncbi:MAG TPA: alpha-amylase family glycosyl hydrolase [Flavitalea sp.]|nr:alpha-amylase family glycosyl hydrolase [Flavitalea sp.]